VKRHVLKHVVAVPCRAEQ